MSYERERHAIDLLKRIESQTSVVVLQSSATDALGGPAAVQVATYRPSLWTDVSTFLVNIGAIEQSSEVMPPT